MRRAWIWIVVVACTRPSEPERRAPVDAGRVAVAAADAHEVCPPDEKARAELARVRREEEARRHAEAELVRAREALDAEVARAVAAGAIPGGAELDAAIFRFVAARKLAGSDVAPNDVRGAIVDAVTASQSCRAVAADDPARCDSLADDKAVQRCRGKVVRLRKLPKMIAGRACDDGGAFAAQLGATCRAALARDEKACAAIEEPHAAASCRAIATADLARCDTLPEKRRANCRSDALTSILAAGLAAPAVEPTAIDRALVQAARGDATACANAATIVIGM